MTVSISLHPGQQFLWSTFLVIATLMSVFVMVFMCISLTADDIVRVPGCLLALFLPSPFGKLCFPPPFLEFCFDVSIFNIAAIMELLPEV